MLHKTNQKNLMMNKIYYNTIYTHYLNLFFITWDMLGAPSNIAGAPSNSMKGQFCPSVKKIKSIFFLPGSILSFSHCVSSAKSFFSSLFPDKLLLRELLRQPLDPFAFEVGGLLLSFGFVMHYIRVG